MKKIFFAFFAFLFLISFISAEVNVTFNIYNATIVNNQRIDGNSPVEDFSVIGYTCGNLACTLIDQELSSLSGSSNSNKIKLVFPTDSSPYGYLLYFYKDGYIGYEESSITYSGSGKLNYPNNIYLSKKYDGIAEIQNVNGVNTNISNGTTLNLNYKVVADGISKDAILDLRKADYPLKEKVKVNSWFLIKNNLNQIIYQEKESDYLEYSGEFTNSFDYKFENAGLYNITIISEISDDKILNPENSTFNFLTNVYLTGSSDNNQTNQTEQNSTEEFYGFSNITSLNFTNLSSNYSFLIEQFSTKINQSGEFSLSSNLTIKVIKYLDNLLYLESRILNNTENVFDFNYLFTSIGNYTINFRVCPILSSNFSCAERNISIQILNNSFSEEDEDDEKDDDSCHSCKKKKIVSDGYEEDKLFQIKTLNYGDEYQNNTISLNFNKKNLCLEAELIYYWILFLLISSLIIISLIILYISKQHL
jgi:hypothetical protein